MRDRDGGVAISPGAVGACRGEFVGGSLRRLGTTE